MLTLEPQQSWQPPTPPQAWRRVGPGFSAAQRRCRGGATEGPRICIDELGELDQAPARSRLREVLAAEAAEGGRPEVAIPGVGRGDDLVRAAILALFVDLHAPGTSVRVFVDADRLGPEILGRFERAMPSRARLLRTLEQATFARMHYLVGQQDHAGIRAFAPLLPFIRTLADGDRRRARQLARGLDLQKRNLQLMVTRRCQLRCVYCPADKRDEDLSLDRALAAIELLLATESDRIRVDFAGGEPLLRKPWLAELMATVDRRAAAAGKTVSYYLVTNGIELDDAFCRWLATHDAELEISIDGDEETHNRHTVAVVPDLNPYRALVRGFGAVQRHDLHYNAVLVFTPASFPALARNLEHVVGLGFRNVAINYAIGYAWEEDVVDRYLDLLADFVERYDRRADPGRPPIFLESLRHKAEPTVLNSELMVDTDGSLHLLSEWQFRSAFRRQPAPFGDRLGELASIDDVFFTKAEIYHLLYEVYRSPDGGLLSLIHNSVATGLRVARGLRQRLGIRVR